MQRVSGFAEQGAEPVWTMGYHSRNVFQETFQFATISVYLTGTTTLAKLFHDNNTPPTPLANPFTADEHGWWWFYAPDGRYDIQISPKPPWPFDCPWTIGDVLVFDPTLWSADQNANGHCLLNLGCLTFSNPNCPAGARVWLNDQCSLQISVPLQTECVKFADNGPAIWMCADPSGTLHIRDTNGVDIASINQGGLLDVQKLVAEQIEATQSIYSLGILGSNGDINTHGNIWADGNAYVHGFVSTPCVQYISGGPAMWLCADSSGTLHIRDTNGNDVGSINQGGLWDVSKLVAQDIEATQSIATPMMQTQCVHYVTNALAPPPGSPSMWMCLDSSGTLQITNGSGNNLASLNQGGLLDLFKVVAQQIEGVQSIWSLGTLGSQNGIQTFGTIVAPTVQAGTLAGNCVQWWLPSAPGMQMCLDAAGTVHIINSVGADIGSINQGGFIEAYKFEAQQIEAVQSIWSLGILGSNNGISTPATIVGGAFQTTGGSHPGPGQSAIFTAQGSDGNWYQYSFSGGIMTQIGAGSAPPPPDTSGYLPLTGGTLTGGLTAPQMTVNTGNVNLNNGGCLFLSAGGPSVRLCVDSAGTLHIRNASGADMLSISQGGFVNTDSLYARQIEGTQSVWSLGLFGADNGGTGTLVGGDGKYYAFNKGVLISIT